MSAYPAPSELPPFPLCSLPESQSPPHPYPEQPLIPSVLSLNGSLSAGVLSHNPPQSQPWALPLLSSVVQVPSLLPSSVLIFYPTHSPRDPGSPRSILNAPLLCSCPRAMPSLTVSVLTPSLSSSSISYPVPPFQDPTPPVLSVIFLRGPRYSPRCSTPVSLSSTREAPLSPLTPLTPRPESRHRHCQRPEPQSSPSSA